MTAEGIFHDAHEVYMVEADGNRIWIATFAHKGLADWYVKAVMKITNIYTYEVVPV